MKTSTFTLFLALICSVGFGQNNSPTQALLISPDMFTNSEFIRISPMYFIKGHDSKYAQKECDMSRWQKLNPSGIKSDMYDQNKRLEGWFRTKLKVDTAFKDTPLYIRLYTWGAVDLYIDGKLIKQFGNTGSNGKPFEEYNHISKIPTLINLQAGQEHILAIHYVDYLSPFPPHQIKYIPRFVITTNEYVERVTKHFNEEPFYYTLWIAICGLISLLLWILAIQNRGEKDLNLIAFLVTLVTISAIGESITNSPTVNSVVSYLNFRVARIVSALMGLILPLLIVSIFNREATKTLKSLLVLVFLAHIFPIFYIENSLLINFRTFMPILICLYYIITSRKTLKGAQWAVVAGILISLFWLSIMFFYAVFYKKFVRVDMQIVSICTTGVFLSFPFGLLMYVAMRFKEIINEVKHNSEQVMKLSEEKNTILETQKDILEKQVKERTAELVASQNQLIQKEKLASLGELTAGIAHEIQNPLNFVNNFSEVSSELVAELEEEQQKPDRDSELEAELLGDLKQNLQKITQHGHRASSIVKGMLEHSRASTGERQQTDMNQLADEYLRLAYHGLRAKDKLFNAQLVTNLAPDLPKLSVVSQDIGRVLLNLYNNGFYATQQRTKNLTAGAPGRSQDLQDLKNYNPTLTVQTECANELVIIRVRDNGAGMPESVKTKIFQPFFTTKPTGEGTGLGLSLAYDIVTKGHGGTIEVTSVEGQGTEFIVTLPA